ncbi:BON domain-containing protein [Lysobacter tyrosinilyticus]
MKGLFRLAAAFAVGAVVMYYLDPVVGRRRRALARDRGMAMGHELQGRVRAQSKRAADRVRGALARSRASRSNVPVDDDILRERIRAKLGHLLEHPSAVEVHVQDGVVTLGGHVGAEEIDDMLDVLADMLGVEGIENHLSIDGSDVEPMTEPGAIREARH